MPIWGVRVWEAPYMGVNICKTCGITIIESWKVERSKKARTWSITEENWKSSEIEAKDRIFTIKDRLLISYVIM